ncbi:MAG: 30S ribosomal protein S3 [Methanocellales archaeon]|nr:30S ribosomal protein S3 [Methanocellales archaeon]
MAIERKFIQEGLKKVRINEYFIQELNRAGYSGMKVNRTPMGTQITIYAEKPGMVIGKVGKTVRTFTKKLDEEFQLDNPQIDVQEVVKPELNAQMMANRLANALERGWYFRKAGHSTLQRIMNAGALGCEIIISGKITGPRKRREKFLDGCIKHAGIPAEELVDKKFAIAIKKLGVLGVQVKIVQPDVVMPDNFRIISEEDKEIIADEKSADIKPTDKSKIDKKGVNNGDIEARRNQENDV